LGAPFPNVNLDNQDNPDNLISGRGFPDFSPAKMRTYNPIFSCNYSTLRCHSQHGLSLSAVAEVDQRGEG
jgi:hypothetical protein